MAGFDKGMSQLVCPLCGRFVSFKSFDPSGFESDIFAVIVKGLGRGRGFAVSEMFSVLNEPEITGPISKRCREILFLIEGKKALQFDEMKALKADLEHWKSRFSKERLAKEDQFARLAELEGQVKYWKKETVQMQRARDDLMAELASGEDETRRWKKKFTRLEEETKILSLQIKKMEDHDVDVYDEEEMLAVEEMQELLDRINASASTDFEYLCDAVDFLLEGG